GAFRTSSGRCRIGASAVQSASVIGFPSTVISSVPVPRLGSLGMRSLCPGPARRRACHGNVGHVAATLRRPRGAARRCWKVAATAAALAVAALALLAPAAAPRPTAGTVAAGDSAGSAGPFGGKGLFTAWDASSALRAAGKVRWVAVDPSTTTDRQVGELRAAGLEIMVWQPLATQAGVAAVRHYGAAGYIAQAETPAELAAAEAVASSLTVPKALVSNNFLDRYPAGWIAMPEAYENEASYISVGAVVADARARGASVIVPVIGVFNPATPGSVKLPASAYA